MGLKNVKAFCKDNANTIFTICGIIFSIGAVIEAVHATSVACKKIEDAEYDKWSDMGEPEDDSVDISLTPAETIKLVWPNYILTTILSTGAIVCDIAAFKSGQKKIDALTGAYVMASQTVTAIKETMKENLPEKDIRKIESGTVHKMVNADKQDPEVASKIVHLQTVGDTSTIYRDAYSPKGCGVYLKGNMDQYRKAVHLYNQMLERYDTATINDWYDCLSRVGVDIGHSDLGDVLRFNHEDGPMELYAVPDDVDPDFDDNAVISIGLRKYDRGTTDLAIPTTPHGIY